MEFSDSERGQSWLAQMNPVDVPLAQAMLDQFLLVPTSEFRQWIAAAVTGEAKRGRLALHGERELPPRSRFFPTFAPGKVRRAIGAKGPALVSPGWGSASVGSEGIVGQLVSELARRKVVAALLTPGPDLIGSGNRINRMLDAMWRTESIWSWHSHRKVPLEVIVIAYAVAPEGLEKVDGHRLRPTVRCRRVVPTIWEVADDPALLAGPCGRYEPLPRDAAVAATGYEEAGTRTSRRRTSSPSTPTARSSTSC